ncbi:MAG: histidinol-phosphate transaminase [Candidatus Aminicenantes bacterium RBG_16_63_16]|nr:MAG: histidinol-phosphate transaminase [Candidatus Aminicenantes bacterium RBG_16_63_16]
MSLIKPGVSGLETYAVSQDRDCVKLNQNESPDDLPPEMKRAVLTRLGGIPWNRYPPQEAADLTRRLSTAEDFPAEGILVGNGSNELIQTLVSAVCGPGDFLVTVTPGFSVYKRVAAALGIGVVEAPLREDFSFDVEDIIARGRGARLVIFASPNNPTGTALELAGVEVMAEAMSGMIAIDEAYFEFHGRTAQCLIAGHDNLIVLRTFSKAMSLAGLRLGYLLGSPGVVRDLAKAKLPFSVGALQQAVALEVLARPDLVERRVRGIVAERERLTEALRQIPGITPVPSRANFVLFGLRDLPASAVYERLLRGGVLVRPFGGPRLEDKLRVTVGTPSENDAFLAGLRRICGGARP